MKNKSLLFSSIAVFLFALVANLQYAFNDYNVPSSLNLSEAIIGQANAQSTGGTNTSSSNSTSTSTRHYYGTGSSSPCPEKGGYDSNGVRHTNNLTAWNIKGKYKNGVSFDLISTKVPSVDLKLVVSMTLSQVKAVEYTCDASTKAFCIVCNMYKVL